MEVVNLGKLFNDVTYFVMPSKYFFAQKTFNIVVMCTTVHVIIMRSVSYCMDVVIAVELYNEAAVIFAWLSL